MSVAASAKKVYAAAALFAAVIVAGTVGYMILEKADPLAALYMTVITVATVGYGEVVNLDGPGRVFTIFLILAGITSWTLFTVTMVAFLVEGEFTKLFRERSIKKRIAKMQDHLVICGLGQTGRSVLEEIMSVKARCVVVEKNPAVAEAALADYPDLSVIQGDATVDAILDQANVQKARGLIAATESDADNLFIVLSARAKNSHMTITARATRLESYDKLRYAGANHVVMPNVIGGVRMASTLLRPNVVSFLDVMMRGPGEPLRMEQANVPSKSKLVGKMLAEASIPQKTGLLVLAIKHESGEYTFNPTSTERIQAEDILIVIGKPEQMPRLRNLIDGGNTA